MCTFASKKRTIFGTVRNDYGEGDLVVMSVEAFEERDKVLKHR